MRVFSTTWIISVSYGIDSCWRRRECNYKRYKSALTSVSRPLYMQSVHFTTPALFLFYIFYCLLSYVMIYPPQTGRVELGMRPNSTIPVYCVLLRAFLDAHITYHLRYFTLQVKHQRCYGRYDAILRPFRCGIVVYKKLYHGRTATDSALCHFHDLHCSISPHNNWEGSYRGRGPGLIACPALLHLAVCHNCVLYLILFQKR